MNDKQHALLIQYVNDVIAMERDIANAIEVQIADDRVKAHVDLHAVLTRMHSEGVGRMNAFRELSKAEGGSFGEAVKEGIMAVTGTLGGWYAKVREHPVSRMVRDDVTAEVLAATSYNMLLTLALSFGHPHCESLALRSIHQCPGIVIRLHDLLPAIVASELAHEGPLASPSAAQVAQMHFKDAWNSRV